jgi:Zn-dependent protease with chaperone function
MLHRISLFTLNYIEIDIYPSCFQCNNEDEIVSVIAHELGHWKLNHTVYSFVAVQVFTHPAIFLWNMHTVYQLNLTTLD